MDSWAWRWRKQPGLGGACALWAPGSATSTAIPHPKTAGGDELRAARQHYTGAAGQAPPLHSTAQRSVQSWLTRAGRLLAAQVGLQQLREELPLWRQRQGREFAASAQAADHWASDALRLGRLLYKQQPGAVVARPTPSRANGC